MKLYQQTGQLRRNEFLETYNLSRLNQKQIETWTIRIKIELVIKKPSTSQTPGPDAFSADF